MSSRRIRQALLDFVSVSLFAGIGRLAHHESLNGWFHTAWPFLVGLGIWSLLMWRRPAFTTPVAGVFGAAVTVAIGSILRVFTHQGVQWSFIAVALTFNALLLVATRILVRFWERSA